MVYNREDFIPEVKKREVNIKYNKEIIGFILIQPEMDEDIDFFSSISRKRFNDSLRKLNNILQRRFCDKKNSLSRTYFKKEIFFIKIFSIFFFIAYIIMFFLVDHSIIGESSEALDNIRYPTLAIQIMIVLFFIYFVFLMMMNKNVYNLEEKVNVSIEDFIKREENFYRSEGYRWNFSERKQELIIERDF